MRTAQAGDHVQVHYLVRSQDGSSRSSRGRQPLELTVGIDHPRLPGLGRALVGLVPGEGARLTVPPERGYGASDPSRVRRWPRRRFPQAATLRVGSLVRITTGAGRRRLVRIMQANSKVVVIDANHRWAGQALDVEVQLISIQGADPDPRLQDQPSDPPAHQGSSGGQPAARAMPGVGGLYRPCRAVAFDVDAASLASLRQGLVGWEIDTVQGATAASLAGWEPGAVDLLVVGVRNGASETLQLCQFLVACTGHSDDRREGATEPVAPRAKVLLVVLVPDGQDPLVGAALRAGASSCLTLPIHPKEVRSMLAHARARNHPGRHTLNLDPAQGQDRWRDTGGEG